MVDFSESLRFFLPASRLFSYPTLFSMVPDMLQRWTNELFYTDIAIRYFRYKAIAISYPANEAASTNV